MRRDAEQRSGSGQKWERVIATVRVEYREEVYLGLGVTINECGSSGGGRWVSGGCCATPLHGSLGLSYPSR